jgi:hypothetical protein
MQIGSDLRGAGAPTRLGAQPAASSAAEEAPSQTRTRHTVDDGETPARRAAGRIATPVSDALAHSELTNENHRAAAGLARLGRDGALAQLAVLASSARPAPAAAYDRDAGPRFDARA